MVGANGIAFSNGGTRMFVANTGFRNIIQIPVTNGTAGAPFILATGINGPDGIAVDPSNRIWVAANQSDEIVVIDGTNPSATPGRVITKLGDFYGLSHGAPIGLLFPASLALSKDGTELYVSNPAFTQSGVCPVPPPAPPLPCNPPPSIDSAWTGKVTGFTVVKINTRSVDSAPTFPAP
jgi:DNA-binding beta-propeller fold protein YncE